MAVQWLLVCHGLVTLLVVVSFLCGQWPIFQGTFIQRIHFFITFGAHDYFRRFIHFACGSRGSDALLSVEYYCCDRPNPILQLIYFLIIGATYYFIATSFFIYITRVLFKWSAQEMFLNTCRLILMIIFYSQRKNVQLAKSQNLLDRSTVAYVIARFDHHYGWMNNCIGERNTRYFMAFILWHFIICVYGIVAPALILAGRLKDLKVIYILTNDYGIENSFRRLAPIVIQWLSNSYNTQILIMVFLAVVSLMLAVFSTYHAKLCITNTTTNESFKWHEYLSWQTKVNEAKVSAAALKASLDELNNERSPEESEWRIFVEDLVYRNWKW